MNNMNSGMLQTFGGGRGLSVAHYHLIADRQRMIELPHGQTVHRDGAVLQKILDRLAFQPQRADQISQQRLAAATVDRRRMPIDYSRGRA